MTNKNFTIMAEIEAAYIGGLAYFLIHMSEYMPYVVISLMGTIIGVFGNLENSKFNKKFVCVSKLKAFLFSSFFFFFR